MSRPGSPARGLPLLTPRGAFDRDDSAQRSGRVLGHPGRGLPAPRRSCHPPIMRHRHAPVEMDGAVRAGHTTPPAARTATHSPAGLVTGEAIQRDVAVLRLE